MDTPETWTFVVGQHESDRRVPVSPDLIQRAHDSNVRRHFFLLLAELLG